MTKQTQHTPGPWVVVTRDLGPNGLVYDVDGNIEGVFVASDIENLGTARLIAAAPDLKESNEEQQDILCRIIPFLENLVELDTVCGGGAVAALIRKVKSAIEHSEQALAKAEGGE